MQAAAPVFAIEQQNVDVTAAAVSAGRGESLPKSEGVELNQRINVAVAEKLDVSRTMQFFEGYTRDADVD